MSVEAPRAIETAPRSDRVTVAAGWALVLLALGRTRREFFRTHGDLGVVHFWQDVRIFSFLAVGSITAGG